MAGGRCNEAFDSIRSIARIVVLPNSHDRPSSFRQPAIVETISLPRPGEFDLPPRPVGLREFTVLGTAMPEAAVHEDGDPSRTKDNVGPAP